MQATSSNSNEKKDDTGGILLSLPQCDMERPDNGVSGSGSINGIGASVGISNAVNKKKSMKTTAKRADLVLFQLPKSKKGNEKENTIRSDILEGRCKILASTESASLVTPSTSLQLVSVGSSNAIVVWKKGECINSISSSNQTATREESPTKRLKLSSMASGISSATTTTATPCRLIQPGGSGSSFLVGQPHELDPKNISHFFVERYSDSSTVANANASTSSPIIAPISTSDLCNLFQIAPNQLWKAMLKVPAVVSYYKMSKNEEREEFWLLIPEEEVLFGQQALVETLCEEDNDFENEDDDDETNLNDASSRTTATTLESMAVKVSQRLIDLLMETITAETNYVSKEERSLAIARKTVILASSSSYATNRKTKLNDTQNSRFRPDASRIAFYTLRDLFLKYPSYAWSDLSEQWSSRLPVGERYERITSTPEWIEDKKMGGHGGLVPNQLIFSPSASALVGTGGGNSNDEKNHESTNSKMGNDGFGNAKGVVSLVDPHAVLIWRGK